jgi:cytochrome oxidase Cu insertion factor (SCO1/SenC/PrrC family)
MLRLFSILLVLVASSRAVHAHPEGGANRPGDAATTATTAATTPKHRAARLFFSDRRLVTQHGEAIAFYSGVLRDKVVLINFIFTQCTDACPTQTARLAEVQALLADLIGNGVSLVSISVDPEHDTPRALSEYAARFGAADGWLFLTGAKADVDDVLRRLGQLAPIREAHTTLFLLGNAKTGHWIKVHPEAAPEEIARQMRLLEAETSRSPANAVTTQPLAPPGGVAERR